jgi:ubiquitin-protein ligase
VKSGWFGIGFINDQPIDFSTFAQNNFILHFAIKTTANCPLFVKLESGGYPGFAKVNLSGRYNVVRNGQWHVIEIPMSAFFAQGLVWNGNMSGKNYFTLISEQSTAGQVINLDYVYFYAGTRDDGSVYTDNIGEVSSSNPTWFVVASEHTDIANKPEYVDLRPNGSDINMYVWENTAVEAPATGTAFEGAQYANLKVTAPAGWFGFGFTNNVARDFSPFAKQKYTLHFAVKTTSLMPLFIKLEGLNGTTAIGYLTGKYDFTRDGQWHEIQIPMSAFFSQGLDWNGNMSGKVYFSLVSEKADKNVELGFDAVWFKAGDPIPPDSVVVPVDPETLPDFVIVASEHTNIENDPKYLDLRPNGNDINLYVWENTATGIPQEGVAYEGAQYSNLRINSAWFGFGFINTTLKNFTCFAYKKFILHFALKTTSNMPLFVKLEGRGEAIINLTGKYGFVRDGQWHKIEIPMSEFFNQGLVWDGPMANKNYFTLISDMAEPNAIIGFDDIYFYADKSSAVNSLEQNKLQILQNKTSLHVVNAGNQLITIYNLQGAIIYNGTLDIISTTKFPKGIYLAKAGTQTAKFILK